MLKTSKSDNTAKALDFRKRTDGVGLGFLHTENGLATSSFVDGSRRIRKHEMEKPTLIDHLRSQLPVSSRAMNDNAKRIWDNRTEEAIQGVTSSSGGGRFCSRAAVEQIQRWMFVEGGHLMGVEEMILQYTHRVRDLGVPLDRVFIGGMMLHPQVSAYIWKWESGKGDSVEGHEMPREEFERQKELLSPDEPFTVLLERRATSVRMKPTDPEIPPDCQWFLKEKYQDYLALPLLHRGEMKGGIAWATKCETGFSDEHIAFFNSSLDALSTIMRLHTNDLVMKTLTGRLEVEVAERTRDLEIANKNLAAANNQIVEQSAKQLRHFAMMSHELRTPLNCVIGMASVLQEDETMDESQRKESIGMIVRSGNLLADVVNDVLDYSKLEAGCFELDLSKADLHGTVLTVISAMKIKAQSKNIELNSHLADSVPRFIETDGRRLQQILYNLLGNAVKFSHNGGAIDFSVTSQESNLVFKVKDYGKGIRDRDLETIFEPFNQGSRETLRVHSGTGLGLAIANKLARCLKGDITATSHYGHWAEFVVRLPINSRDTSEQKFTRALPTATRSTLDLEPVRKKAALAPPLKGLRVLVAEDNIVNQKILKKMLERIDVIGHVDVANNGREAVDFELENQYDIVLMDMQMPVMDGLEATKIITSRPRISGSITPKVVFVTAHALDDFRERAHEAGGCDFVSKPFTIGKLRSVLGALNVNSVCNGSSHT